MINPDLIKRYEKIILTFFENPHVLKPFPEDPDHPLHLLWMLSEIKENTKQSLTKKHRWLGYIQGVLVAKGYTSVNEEREATRPMLNGA